MLVHPKSVIGVTVAAILGASAALAGPTISFALDDQLQPACGLGALVSTDAIVGSGISAIVGSGTDAIIGSGISAIVGSGTDAIVGSGISAIVGSGTDAIVGSGISAIVGSGIN